MNFVRVYDKASKFWYYIKNYNNLCNFPQQYFNNFVWLNILPKICFRDLVIWYCTFLLKEWKTSCGLQLMKVPWYYLTNAIKRATFPNNKVYECQTKDDISWQFICVSLCWQFSKISLKRKKFFCKTYISIVCIIIFSISWQEWVMLQITINMLDSSIL